MITEHYFLVAFPFVVVLAGFSVLNYRAIFLSFFVLVPFSMEFYFGSLGLDLPTEPIMLVLMGLSLFLLSSQIKTVDAKYITHALSVLLFLHMVWIFFTSLHAQNVIFSFKYLLAKLWYVIPFYFLPMFLLDKGFMLRVFKAVSFFLFIATSIVLVRHSQYNFEFKYYNEVVYPIFRNHVTYAAMLVTVLPFTWVVWKNETQRFKKRLWFLVLLIFVIGIYFSYTRAAQACILIAIGAYYIIQYKLSRFVIIGSFIGAMVLGIYLVNDNKYLDYRPEFEKTITHYSYDNLIDATLKMEDISTMERVYRWVAGGHMVNDKPWIGQGPSNFYSTYRSYTENGFKTYVSNNPEKSGIHNYFFMILVEQGIIGLIIYSLLNFIALFKGERLYHRLDSRFEKTVIMATLCSIIVVTALQMMNDLIEVDKIGPFYFLSLSIIVVYDIKSNKLRQN